MEVFTDFHEEISIHFAKNLPDLISRFKMEPQILKYIIEIPQIIVDDSLASLKPLKV